MPTAITPLASVTLSASQTSITFSSIDQSFRDYMLVCQIKGTTGTGIYCQLNNDTGNNYWPVFYYSNGSGTGGYAVPSNTSNLFGGNNGVYVTASDGFNMIMNFIDATATKGKNIITRDSNAGVGVGQWSQYWTGTAAINTIKVYAGSAVLAAGSTFCLYGVSA